VQDLESLLRGIVASKRALGEERLSKRSDLISVLLLAKDDEGRSLSDRQIRDQLMTFLQAGHETTALTLTYAIYLISKNPEIQEKLAEEVSPFKHRAVGADEMDAFPFLKQVTLEALRLYPSSWMVGRDAVEEDSISGWRIPQGSSVIVPVWSMHRDARVFADPEAFRPERWTEEFQKGLHRTRYMPFGYGPRMCIGFGLAQLELQIILGTIYSRKRTSLAAGKPLKVMASVTARPKNDVMIRFDDLV
jgi:cytochrome P450